MFTNTFVPHVGGVAHSVSWLARDLRRNGHRVLVVAPEYAEAPEGEEDVLRLPALRNFAGSDFSVPVPFARSIDDAIEAFAPDIVHSHHPFLLGDMALRTGAALDLPVVYTYHTRYELYGHYVAQDAPALRRLILSLSTGYCELCDAVIAPSRSIARHLSANGVETPVSVIPTGIDLTFFSSGDRARARIEAGIPDDAFVVGHVGRLALEKNLDYLSDAVVRFLASSRNAHFLVAGQGEMTLAIRARFEAAGLAGRLHLAGTVTGHRLADIYAAMDVFAFSSLSETQGLVLAEAMAAGVPVVALDAAGAREIVSEGRTGRLLPGNAPAAEFAAAIGWVEGQNRSRLRAEVRRSVAPYSREETTRKTVSLYASLLALHPGRKPVDDSHWKAVARRVGKEWRIFRNMAHAVGDAVLAPGLLDTER